jgi:hypothetical protein
MDTDNEYLLDVHGEFWHRALQRESDAEVFEDLPSYKRPWFGPHSEAPHTARLHLHL